MSPCKGWGGKAHRLLVLVCCLVFAIAADLELLRKDCTSCLRRGAQTRLHGSVFLPGVSTAETVETSQAQPGPAYRLGFAASEGA